MIKTIIDYWDTPYPVLEGDVASAGIPVWVRQPRGDGTFTLRAALQAATPNASAVSVFEDATKSASVLIDDNGDQKEGRIATLINYWAGGAPGHHGAAFNGQIAYRFKCVLRPVNGRSWWSSTTIPSWYLALGGNGFFRVDKVTNGGSTVETIYSADFTDDIFLDGDGLHVIGPIDDMGPADWLDIYYVQDENFDWGGYVFKVLLNPDISTAAAKEEAIRNAPVLGCDLFDTGTQPTKITLSLYGEVNVERSSGAVASGKVQIPLANSQNFDGVGWQWVKETAESPGYVKLFTGSLTQNVRSVFRQRLLRVKGGFTTAAGVDEQYTMFTGFIDDFDDPDRTGTFGAMLAGFEQRLMDQHMKNFPDRISYMSANFRKRRGTSQPVYDTPAYDRWPMELMLRDIFARAGLPESLTRQQLKVTLSDGTTRIVSYGTQLYQKFRARSMAGNQIQLDRPVRYGNNGEGFDPKKAPDDEYIFKPENTRELWNSVRDVAERYGYDLWFDEFGHCVLRASNNPSFIDDLPVTDGSTQQTHPNAYAGTYQQWSSGQSPTVTKLFSGARVDVIFPRFVGAGSWSFTVVDENAVTVNSGTVNPSLPSGSADEFFYDYRTTIDGGNSTVATLFSGEFGNYTVTLTATGGAATRRLDAFLYWYSDPLMPRFDHLFSTTENALDVTPRGTMNEMRNFVIVVGRRKSVVTDSTKLETNPNNPSYEFIVKGAVDVESILDPTAPNFIGYHKESVIYDPRITDDDYAGYLANAFIFKYRNPKPAATIEHTLVPVLQLREPIYAVEQKFGTLTADAALFVTAFRHNFSYGKATTTIETTSYVPLPAYEPREDIDIDANFGGNAVINVDISYRTIDDTLRSNVPLGAAADCDEVQDIVIRTGKSLSGTDISMSGEPWPPIPGTVFLYPNGGAAASGINTVLQYTPSGPSSFGGAPGEAGLVTFNGTITSPRLENPQSLVSVQLQITNSDVPFGTPTTRTITLTTTRPTVTVFDAVGQWYYEYQADKQVVVAFRVNGPVPPFGTPNPYRFSLVITYLKASGGSDITKALTNSPYHHLFNVDYRDANRIIRIVWNEGDNFQEYLRNIGVTTYDVKYRKLWPGGATSDPYAGDCPFYDPYSSALGELVSIKADFLLSGLYRISVRSIYTDEVVAWLTEPGADPEDPEAHWQFFTAGAARTINWDGVDDVGTWNSRMSRLWAVYAQGAFERDELPVVGRGFYAWNQEEQGDGTLGKLALISGQRNASNGSPLFGHGTYACWYVKWEVLNDRLGETPRTVSSKNLASAFNGGDTSAVVYTHLGAPTRLEIAEVADFTPSQVYNETSPPPSDSGFWQTIPTADAIVNNQKPVRIRYAMIPRPGTQWTGNGTKDSVRIFELAHLRVTIHDQFTVFDGGAFPGTTIPKRTIVSRRLMNDEHSVLFSSDEWVTGTGFKTVTGGTGREWIFLPKDFEKDFGNGFDEPLEFNNYLQIEEVPYWDESRQIAGKRSRLHIAFMNYLFFLSTYTQDRSGRFCWAVNRKWVDRSKIVYNSYGDWWDPASPGTVATATTYRTEEPADLTYQHRRTVVCRQWQDEANWKSSQQAAYGLTDGSVGEKLLRHKWSDHDPAVTTLNGAAWPSLDSDNHSKWHADGRTELPSQFNSLTRQLGTSSTTRLGSWTWESDPMWVPCVSRDFHPYFLLPPMPDPPGAGVNVLGRLVMTEFGDFNTKFVYLQVDSRKYNSDDNSGNDPAAAEIWNSPVWDMSQSYSSAANGKVRFWPGTTVDANAGPTKDQLAPTGPSSNVADYIRQDETTHYEDLRGIFSRGPRPAEASRKVTPSGPYYTNQFSYQGLTVQENVREKDDNIIAGSPGYPKYRVFAWSYTNTSGFFDMKFRHQYYWESGTLFPTDSKGVEALFAMNHTKSRMVPPDKMANVRFDDGAWTGWKDDVITGGFGDINHRLFHTNLIGTTVNVFETGFMPIAVGPRIRAADSTLVTLDMIFSMVLVNERREGSI